MWCIKRTMFLWVRFSQCTNRLDCLFWYNVVVLVVCRDLRSLSTFFVIFFTQVCLLYSWMLSYDFRNRKLKNLLHFSTFEALTTFSTLVAALVAVDSDRKTDQTCDTHCVLLNHLINFYKFFLVRNGYSRCKSESYAYDRSINSFSYCKYN